MPGWNPVQYEKFLKDRTQPAIDLASRLEALAPDSILDLGCGPGNSTKVLKDRFPAARIVGADNSAAMLDKARNSFVEFTTRFYDVKITDNEEAQGKLIRWADDFELEDKYLKVDNQFDLIYKNSKINEYKSKQNILIGACAVLLVISIILLAFNIR